MTIRLISFRAPLLEGDRGDGFVIPAALSREYMQFAPKVPGIDTPVHVKGRRTTLLEKWGLIVMSEFRSTFTFTRFGRVVFRYTTANGKAAGLTYADFLSHFVNGFRSTAERDRGIKRAILARRADFFADVPQDIQFLYTVGLLNEQHLQGVAELDPDPDEFDIL